MKFLAVLLLAMMGVARVEAATCETCEKVEKLAKAYEDDETKAYEKFNKLISDVPLSKDKQTRKAELEIIIKTAVLMEKSDGPQELAQYLYDMQKEYPEDFKKALGVLSKEQRKDLEDQIKIAKDLMEKGEEP